MNGNPLCSSIGKAIPLYNNTCDDVVRSLPYQELLKRRLCRKIPAEMKKAIGNREIRFSVNHRRFNITSREKEIIQHWPGGC